MKHDKLFKPNVFNPILKFQRPTINKAHHIKISHAAENTLYFISTKGITQMSIIKKQTK